MQVVGQSSQSKVSFNGEKQLSNCRIIGEESGDFVPFRYGLDEILFLWPIKKLAAASKINFKLAPEGTERNERKCQNCVSLKVSEPNLVDVNKIGL
ncbi:hypothetical protein AVEN_57236-1 [Araneus ventricosus]|uniref:Uncharacterized protein n=1 Tax=Araneus ventricosus TaxID=182803 RepID=A0A4Y2RKG2_ARAVE|nr:hypothetical protein AVEN_57236-1 [Araneus ventricosus]